MSLTLAKTPTNSRVSLKRPSSYAIHVTSPLVPYILPLMFRDAPRALVALDEVCTSLNGADCQVWLISPMGHVMEYRATA